MPQKTQESYREEYKEKDTISNDLKEWAWFLLYGLSLLAYTLLPSFFRGDKVRDYLRSLIQPRFYKDHLTAKLLRKEQSEHPLNTVILQDSIKTSTSALEDSSVGCGDECACKEAAKVRRASKEETTPPAKETITVTGPTTSRVLDSNFVAPLRSVPLEEEGNAESEPSLENEESESELKEVAPTVDDGPDIEVGHPLVAGGSAFEDSHKEEGGRAEAESAPASSFRRDVYLYQETPKI